MFSTRPYSMGIRPFLLVFCFLAAFSVSAFSIRWLFSGRYIPFFSEKLTVFESGKDEYTLLFIGSSHFRSGIDPILFDQLTAEAGCPTRSFNFSLPAMHLPEILHLIRRIRALEPANLQWVVVEPRITVHFDEENSKKQRLIYYHDLPATVMALSCIHHRELPDEGRFHHFWLHLQHFFFRQTNQGLAQSLITEFYRGNAPARREKLQSVLSGQGYNPLEGRKLSRSRRGQYLEKLRDFPSTFRKRPLKPGLARHLVTLAEQIDAMGARAIFLFPPAFDSGFDLVLPERSPPVNLIRLDDPETYPALFALENRRDQGHVNSEGAVLTTTAAAEAFLRIAAGKDNR